MDLEIIVLSEVNQNERQIPYDITYMGNLKYDANKYLQNRNRFTDIENWLVVAKGERVEEGCIGSLGLAGANYYV